MIIPEPMNTIQALIDAAHEKAAEDSRPHLGVSTLGHPCDRWLWLSFRWAVKEQFEGRMLRLFRRGQMEEATIVSDLRRIGIDVTATGEHQSRVSFGSHVSGSVDGIVSNLPNAPKTKAVLECKTHSDKSFKELVDKGLEKSKPMHWVQCQVYMLGMKLDRALYYAVNKNTDHIYTEWLKLDKELAQKYVDRGKRIALDDRMPPPVSTDPTWYECRFCAAHSFCHKQEPTKYANCRTCAHSTAKEDSTWRCEKHQADGIPVEFQRKGCASHQIHPELVPWKYTMQDDIIVWHTPWGDIANGEGDAHIYESSEILANPEACAKNLGDEFRREFDGRIMG